MHVYLVDEDQQLFVLCAHRRVTRGKVFLTRHVRQVILLDPLHADRSVIKRLMLPNSQYILLRVQYDDLCILSWGKEGQNLRVSIDFDVFEWIQAALRETPKIGPAIRSF